MSKREYTFAGILLIAALLIAPAAAFAKDALQVETGILTVTVFNDHNRNGGMDDDESGIKGAKIAIFDETDAEVGNAETDGTLSYDFADLALGTYTVVETDAEGFFSTTPNELVVVLTEAGANVSFGDFMPEEGEVSDHELLLWEYFDVFMNDVLYLRDTLDWGYGNIARALFLVQMSETTLEEIIALRGGDGEMHGWGNILRSILGHPSLKRHNWGSIVSGRAAPEGGMAIAQSSAACGLEAETYAEYLATYGPGKVKQACRLADEFDVPAENIFTMLGEGMSIGQIQQALKGAPDALELPSAGEGHAGNGNGPPPCKGWRKDDPGC